MLRSSKLLFSLKSKNYSTSNASSSLIKTCIVGSGPAGFYAAQYILKHLPNSHVDLVEKLPVPYGLVRFGVAPDHPEVKNVINTFNKTAGHQNFRFLGNVTLGKDVFLKDLRNAYDVVLLAYGADEDATLNIPNEDKSNVISAREFVGWYNGLPNLENLNPNLSGDTAVLLGQGNVAMDIARILLAQVDELKKTDITAHALEALSKSKIKNVYLVGRRGPLQAAFTIKELREMIKLPNVDTIWRPEDFKGIAEQVESLERPRKRLTELMLKSLSESKTSSNDRKFLPVFFRSPIRVNGDTTVNSIDFSINKLENNRAISTKETETLEVSLACRSIGYKSICVDNDMNFDEKKGLTINENGRVLQKNSTEYEPGLYVSGWLGTGPTGVILTTMNNSFGVAQTICNDIKNGALKSNGDKPGLNLKDHPLVTWKDWQKIDNHEVESGKKSNKPREKILKVDEMLKIVHS
ncbi:unnamed protein product [Diamesa serratosioi]